MESRGRKSTRRMVKRREFEKERERMNETRGKRKGEMAEGGKWERRKKEKQK